MRHRTRTADGPRPGSPADDRAAIERVPNSAGMNQGMQVLSYLISGTALYGLLGWAGDHVLGTAFLLPVGIVLGAALGVYVVIRRLEQTEADPGTSGPGAAGTTTRTAMTGTTGNTTEGNT